MLEKQGISQEFKEAQNSMAVVDAAIRTIKTSSAKEMLKRNRIVGSKRYLWP